MALLLREIDPAWALLVVGPLLFLGATWALQMACAFCSIEPPTFLHSLLMVAALAAANVVARYLLTTTGWFEGILIDYVAPVIVSGVVIALTAPTQLLIALSIAVMHLIFCGLIYFGGSAVAAQLMSRAQL